MAFGHGDKKHPSSEVVNKPEKIINVNSDLLKTVNEMYLRSVKKIFLNKCYDCHGISKKLPWYYTLYGVKQMMNTDMKEAKKHMNMSCDFPFGGHGSPTDDLSALSKTIKNNDMPPLKYRVMHWDSKLTKEEIQAIDMWINESQKRLNAQ